MKFHSAPKRSYFTATDEFCGAGGTTTGAKAAGLEVVMAMNHWGLAIETHNTNHPDVDHDCRDISASDPRRYPRTDFLLASPECTNHSLAKGKRRRFNGTGDLFDLDPDDPANVRSRATMWDVPRFAEYHQYEIIIVENVVDARRWVMWDAWLMAMYALGYVHKCVYFNSMFAPPTPQSRDRMYVVFWRKGNKAPDLDIRPAGWCMRCMAEVQCVQSWKPGRDWGKYGKGGQYIYRCPTCTEEVIPYYYAAFNAIDWSIPSQRIGERERPLKPRTIERIKYGLDRYGREPLVVATRYTSGTACRARGAASEPMQTQPGDATFALVNPGFLARIYDQAYGREVSGPFGTITTVDHHALIGCSPAIVDLAHNRDGSPKARSAFGPLPTQTTGQTLGFVAPAFIAELYGTSKAGSLEEPLMCVTAGGNNHALIDTRAFLAYYYGTMNASGIAEAMATVTTNDRAALVDAAQSARVEDCTFRMLEPHEIKRAMAFPTDYIILGNKRDQVKQLGNAVTPPVSQMLCERAIESLS